VELASSQAGAQTREEAPPIVQPVVEEGYRALAQFLEYDKGLPLDARIVAREEVEGYTRERIVFTGVGRERVPAYLGMPRTGRHHTSQKTSVPAYVTPS